MNNIDSAPSSNSHPGAARSLWLPLLAVGLAGISGFSFYQASHQSAQVDTLRRELATSQQEIATLRSGMMKVDNTISSSMDEIRQQLTSERKGVAQSIAKVQQGTLRHLNAVSKKTAAQQAALAEELSSVKTAAADTSTRVEGVSTEVSSVKTEVASARTALDAASADLKRVNGDMGVMSGLIATNSKEIQSLRELGDRNIYEFTLTRSKELQKVGDIQMRLVKADAKKNRYTVVVFADDRTVEKKDKTTNEPVQFYVASKARMPYEVVVNAVTRNTVTGYLATPKVTTASR